jgi:hypothetical protein
MKSRRVERVGGGRRGMGKRVLSFENGIALHERAFKF